MGELEKVGQFLHVVAASISMYFPATQAVQSSGPVVGLILPAGQAVHQNAPVYPALQTQSCQLSLPVCAVFALSSHSMHEDAAVYCWYLPLGQEVHKEPPVDTLYFPRSHAVHVPAEFKIVP